MLYVLGIFVFLCVFAKPASCSYILANLSFDLFPYSLPDILIVGCVLFLFLSSQSIQFLLFFFHNFGIHVQIFLQVPLFGSRLTTHHVSRFWLYFSPVAIFIYIWLKKCERKKWWTTKELDDKHTTIPRNYCNYF